MPIGATRAYKLPPEANLMALAHYLEALDWQRRFIKIHAILGGKNPHLQSFLVGGMATPVDPDSQNSLNMDTIAALEKLVADGKDFVSRVYLPDVLAIASFYKEWASIGAGVGNYMVYGDYPMDDNANPELFLPTGIIYGRDLSKIAAVDQEKVSEWVAHSWYDYSIGDDKGLNPFKGETNPNYTGPKPPYKVLDVAKKYSWLKSPRYDGARWKSGPWLACLLPTLQDAQRESKNWSTRPSRLSGSALRRYSRLSVGSPRAPSRRRSWSSRWACGSRASPKIWHDGITAFRTIRSGIPAPGQLIASAMASMRPRAARWDIGCISTKARS